MDCMGAHAVRVAGCPTLASPPLPEAHRSRRLSRYSRSNPFGGSAAIEFKTACHSLTRASLKSNARLGWICVIGSDRQEKTMLYRLGASCGRTSRPFAGVQALGLTPRLALVARSSGRVFPSRGVGTAGKRGFNPQINPLAP